MSFLDLVLVSWVGLLRERPPSCSTLNPTLFSAKLGVKALIYVQRGHSVTQALTCASPNLPTPHADQSHPAEKQTVGRQAWSLAQEPHRFLLGVLKGSSCRPLLPSRPPPFRPCTSG